MELRPYQQSALDAWDKFVDGGGRRGLVVLPTGGGKTVVFSQLPARYGRTLVLAHREELLDQAAAHLRRANPDLVVGIEKAERRAGPTDVVVASVPTLGRENSARLRQFAPEDFALVVVDEAHHAAAPTYRRILAHFGSALHLGVTATPQRGDNVRLIEVFDEVVFFLSIEELIAQQYLVPPVGYRVQTTVDLSGVATRAGDFVESALSKTVNVADRNRLAVEAYLNLAAPRRALVFAVDVAHTHDLAQAFNDAGVPAGAVVGTTPSDERREILRRFRAGELSVVVNCAVLTEGFDDPGVGALLLARPTRSALLYTQVIGRGLRLDAGKEDCLVIDLCDATVGKKPVGLPTLLGLPPDFDCDGEDVTEVAKKYRELEALCPEEAVRVRSVADITTSIERIDLFRPPPPDPVVLEYSTFIWMEAGPGRYVLNLGSDDKERITIAADPLGRFDVTFSRRTDGDHPLGTVTGLAEAFKRTDAWVMKFRKDRLAIVDQGAVWRSELPTDKQLKNLKKFGVPVPADLTKGQASLLLERLFAENPRQPKPAWLEKKIASQKRGGRF